MGNEREGGAERWRKKEGEDEVERAAKESEDGCLEDEGAAEREKRCLQLWSSATEENAETERQPTNHDRVRSRSQDNYEGCVRLFVLRIYIRRGLISISLSYLSLILFFFYLLERVETPGLVEI